MFSGVSSTSAGVSEIPACVNKSSKLGTFTDGSTVASVVASGVSLSSFVACDTADVGTPACANSSSNDALNTFAMFLFLSYLNVIRRSQMEIN